MAEKIIAFDPGFTTGVAIHTSELTTVAEVKGLQPVWDLLHRENPDRIVYESFLYQRRDKVDLTPVKIIGAIELFANLYRIPYTQQTPATGKRFWTDAKIKKLGMWEPGEPHAMDALRHLLYYRTFTLKEQELLERLR